MGWSTAEVQGALPSVALAWNPSPAENVTGYTIYFGLAGGPYTQTAQVGNVSAARVYGLAAGATYQFAVTANDEAGNQSELSEAVIFTVPEASPIFLQSEVLNDENGQPFALAISGNTGPDDTWELQYCTRPVSDNTENFWSYYTSGYGSDMYALIWIGEGAEPSLFFRLILR